ncbi:hypothetical protein EDC04DRAFT_3089878 [Pisolithus marmoratus]|nr:hypothetical protein EDC04DRAFT_3089878 [Pisolithus marmoratus]
MHGTDTGMLECKATIIHSVGHHDFEEGSVMVKGRGERSFGTGRKPKVFLPEARPEWSSSRRRKNSGVSGCFGRPVRGSGEWVQRRTSTGRGTQLSLETQRKTGMHFYHTLELPSGVMHTSERSIQRISYMYGIAAILAYHTAPRKCGNLRIIALVMNRGPIAAMALKTYFIKYLASGAQVGCGASWFHRFWPFWASHRMLRCWDSATRRLLISPWRILVMGSLHE